MHDETQPGLDAPDEEPFERTVDKAGIELEKAAREHGSWARAVQINPQLTEQVSKLAESFRVNPRLADELRRSTSRWNSLFDVSEVLEPSVARMNDVARAGVLDALTVSMGAAARSQLAEIQRSLNRLNRPTATRRTQTFLTGTEGLRYRGRKRVWHYTNAQALDQILKRNVLWASNPHHLNDTAELTHGVDAVRAAAERAARSTSNRANRVLAALTDAAFIDEVMHDIYFISASTAEDSLTLWRNYSSADGFAIGLKPASPLKPQGLVVDEIDRDEAVLPNVADWYRVSYKSAEQTRLADAFVVTAVQDIELSDESDEQVVIRELRKHMLVLASTMKHRAFEDEREVRWITTNWAPVDVVHYEVTGRGIVPVLHVLSSSMGEKLPIHGVRCSPTTGPTIERTIRGLLNQRQYVAAAKDVMRSVLPYRG